MKKRYFWALSAACSLFCADISAMNIEDMSILTQILYEAAGYGNLVKAEIAIENGADIEARNSLGHTPLHLAAHNNHFTIADLLLQKGANIEAQNTTGHTPLHIAAGKGRPEIVGLLLQKEANIGAQNADGHTPLHLAARMGQVRTALFLLYYGANLLQLPQAMRMGILDSLFSNDVARNGLSIAIQNNQPLADAIRTTIYAIPTEQQRLLVIQDIGEEFDLKHNLHLYN